MKKESENIRKRNMDTWKHVTGLQRDSGDKLLKYGGLRN